MKDDKFWDWVLDTNCLMYIWRPGSAAAMWSEEIDV